MIRSEIYISDISSKDIAILKNEKYILQKIKLISKVDYIIICLPTPLKNKPDMSHIEKAFKTFLPYLREGQQLF